MEARLHELAGANYTLQVSPDTTLDDLKKTVEEQTGIPRHLIQIRLQGRDLGGEQYNEYLLMNRLQELDRENLLVPPPRKEFSKEVTEKNYIDLDILYDVGGGCLTVYRWRCYFCFIVEFDIANGCTECGICGNKIASRCKDDGCEVNCCCEKCNCECCVGKCTLL